MNIAFSCENCGKDFQTDESFAGKKCKCKQCGHIFVIPAPRTAGSSGSARGVKSYGEAAPRPQPQPQARPRPAARPSRPNYLDESDDPYGLDDAAPLPPRKIASIADDDEEEFRGPKPISMKPKKRKRSSSGSGEFFGGLPNMYYGIAAGIMAATFVMGLISQTGKIMFVGAGVLVAIVPLFYGGIGILVMPFMILSTVMGANGHSKHGRDRRQ